MFTSKAISAYSQSRRLANTLIKVTTATRMAFSSSNESFLNGGNANYIDLMFAQWQKDPASVHASWNAHFSGSNFQEPPTLGKDASQGQLDEIIALLKQGGGSFGAQVTNNVGADRAAKEAVQLSALLNAFESLGHLVADLDPLKLADTYKDIDSFREKFRFAQGPILKQLDYREYGFTEADLDREFNIELAHKSSIMAQKRVWKLRDII